MTASVHSSGSNTEYVAARVRARRAKLFTEEDYRKLVRMGPSGIARYLEENEYEEEINALGARHSGVDLIEYALNRNVAKHFTDLLDWAGGRLHDRLAAYLRTYDVWNIKTVLRGIYTDSPAGEVRTDLIRAGELDDTIIDQLLEAETIESAVEVLEGTIYYQPLTKNLPEYQETNVLVPLENALDRVFYERLLDLQPGLFESEPLKLYREYLQAEIDFRNIRNSLRLARSGADMDPTKYFIEGGILFDPAELRRLVENTDELVTHIQDSKYGDELRGALDQLEAAESLIQFEHALDAALLSYADQLSSRYPVSITAVMSYILAKEREIENIRAIARGREVGLSEEEIQEELVML